MIKSFIKELGLILRFTREVALKEECDTLAAFSSKHRLKPKIATLGVFIMIMTMGLFVFSITPTQANVTSKNDVVKVDVNAELREYKILVAGLKARDVEHMRNIERLRKEYDSVISTLKETNGKLKHDNDSLRSSLGSLKSVPVVSTPETPLNENNIFDELMEIY